MRGGSDLAVGQLGQYIRSLKANSLHDVHPSLPKLQSGVVHEWQGGEHQKGCRNLPFQRCIGANGNGSRHDRVQDVQNGSYTQGNENFP